MTPFTVILEILGKIIEVLGPAMVRGKVDEWEAARAAADLAAKHKFGGDP